jgi:hypothetical protein
MILRVLSGTLPVDKLRMLAVANRCHCLAGNVVDRFQTKGHKPISFGLNNAL